MAILLLAAGPAVSGTYIVTPAMTYQGFINDAEGNPITGSLDFTVSLWDAPSAGAQVWGPEAHSGVSVADGVFSLVLGSSLALAPAVFTSQLYLQLQVGGDTMQPRQPLAGAPYAMTLAPGTTIRGESDSQATVSVHQDGGQYALWAEENGSSGGYGLGADKIYAEEGYASGADTYLWVPGSLAYLSGPVGAADIVLQSTGILKADCTSTGSMPFYIPIAIPSVLYGHDVVIKGVRVYYRVDNAGSPVYLSRLRVLKADGTTEEIATQSADQSSTTYTYFNLPVDSSLNTLTSDAGPMTLLVGWDCNNTSHNFYLGGARLRLGHPRSDQ